MSEPTFPTDQPARAQPTDSDLDFADGQVSDEDRDVVQGIARLEALRASENQIAEARPSGAPPISA